MYIKCLLFASLLVLAIAEENKSNEKSSSQLDTTSSESKPESTSKTALKDALKTSESRNVRNEGHDVNIVITDKGSTLDIRPQQGYSPGPQANDNYGGHNGGGGGYDQYGKGAEAPQDADYGNYGQGGGYDQEPSYGDRVPIDKQNDGYYKGDLPQQQQPAQQQHSEPQYNGAPQSGYVVADKQAEHAYGANQVGHASAGYAGGYEITKQPAYESFSAEGKDAGGQYQVIPANDQYSQGYANNGPADYGNANAGYGNGAPVENKAVVTDYGHGNQGAAIVNDYGNGGQPAAVVNDYGNGGQPAAVPAPDYSQQQHYQQPVADYAAQGGNGNAYKVIANNEPKYDYGGFRPIIKTQPEQHYNAAPQYTAGPQIANQGYDAGQQVNIYPSGGHTAKVILVPAQDILPAKGAQFQYQTTLDHGAKGAGKHNEVQEAGHVVDYGSGKPYGGNLAQKPYSTDYVAGVKTAVPVKETYDTGAYIQKPAYGNSNGNGYGLALGYTPDLGNAFATNGYTSSSILKGPMIGANYDVNIDALLNTIPSNHGSYGGSHQHHSPPPPIMHSIPPPSSHGHGSIESQFSPGGLTSSYNPSLSSSFYAAASSPSFSSPNYGGYGLGSYSTPDVSYAPPMSGPPPMLGHPVYNTQPKFGSFADYTTAADSLLSGSFDTGFGYAPKFTDFSSKPRFPSFRGAYNSVYGYAAASNRIPFVLKAPSSLKNMVKALTGQV